MLTFLRPVFFQLYVFSMLLCVTRLSAAIRNMLVLFVAVV